MECSGLRPLLPWQVSIAPVTAIRGNVDIHGDCALLPATEMVELAGCLVYLVHSLDWIDILPRAAGVMLVVSGHSHKPDIALRGEVLFLNPGSAGPRRFKLPVTVAMVSIEHGVPQARIVELATP
jgi:predicted phosphodiesterase